MEAKITVNLDNAAFDDQMGIELARILKSIAEEIDKHAILEPGSRLILHDINGNTVGRFEVQK